MLYPWSTLSHSNGRQRVVQTPRSITEDLHSLTRVEDSELSKQLKGITHGLYSYSCRRQRVVQTPRCITQDLHSLTRLEDSELSKHPDASHMTYTLSLVSREREREREREMFYLTTHSTHFIYGYMASDIWLRTILIGYSYRLTARVLLYAPSHRQDNTYHGLCYPSRGALAGTRNSSMGPPHEGSIRLPTAP